MKKFLTVLLVIAVMFTFSFSSAFAATDYNKSLASEYFNVAMNVAKEAGTIELDGYTVDYATLEANRADLLAAANDWAKAADPQAYIDGQAGRTIADLLAVADNADLKLAIVAAQYATDKADAVAVLNGVSVSDFSTEAMDPKCTVDGHTCKTYQDHVQAILNDAVADINKAAFNSDSTIADYVAAKAVIAKYFEDYSANMTKTALLLEKGYMAGAEAVGLGVYELNTAYSDNGTPLSHYTADYVNAQGAVDTATIAAVKASVAAAYANYVREDGADKDFAADMMKVLNYLADQKVITSTAVSQYFDVKYKAAVAQAIKNVEAFEADAAKLAAEKDATGALVRDAADVAKLVTEGTTKEYANAVGATFDGKTISAALAAIKALYASLDDAKLAYYKKYVENDINNEVADAEDDYYAPEYAKVKALAEDYIAQINAATDHEAIDKLVTKLDTEIKKIETKNAVDTKTDASKLFAAAKQYAELLNGQISKNANKYYSGSNNDYAKLKADVYKLVGASEARTASAIAALSDQALALVKELPTNAAVDAAKDAADEAVKALPTKVSTADKALIDAAIAAVDAYETLSGETYTTTAIASAALRYAYAFNNEMDAKVKAVSQTDKDAIKALVDEIKAVEDAYGDYASVADVLKTNKDKLNGYLDKIQKTEYDAVKTAINAIPAAQNITEADKATVENARKLYDAYVAEYTEYDSKFAWDACPVTTDGFVADDFGTSYQELVAAETLLGLNAEDPAMAVKAFKIKASSKATKGAMTISWRVIDGDKSAAAGYQVWRSTKANKGFKKMITTKKMTYKNTKNLKKGTTYYYRVRAYARTAEGKLVFSDFSNKAYRKAK